jgi:arylsulfatase A-like enzyme
MDWIAGEILNQIDKSGLVDNTLVILTSDNGPYISEQSCSGKKGAFQGAWYVQSESGYTSMRIFLAKKIALLSVHSFYCTEGCSKMFL